jgi:hypothetical protein
VRAFLADLPEMHKTAACFKMRMIATSNVKRAMKNDYSKYPVSNGRCGHQCKHAKYI